MGQVNVVLTNVDGLLREIVLQALATDVEIHVAGEYGSAAELRDSLCSASPASTAHVPPPIPDVVIATVERTPGSVGNEIPEAHEGLRSPGYLILTDRGLSASIHWLQPRSLSLSGLTPDGLVRAVRDVARRALSNPTTSRNSDDQY